MYLYFAITWLVGGIAILVWHALDPDTPQGRIAGISMGWIALLLGFYNLARWWSYRSNLAIRRADEEAREQRRRRPREESVPDPNSPFDFRE